MTLAEIYSLDLDQLYHRTVDVLGIQNGMAETCLNGLDWLRVRYDRFSLNHDTKRPPEMAWMIHFDGKVSYGDTLLLAVLRGVLIAKV